MDIKLSNKIQSCWSLVRALVEKMEIETKIMRERLLYAIHNCVEMDADFRLSESEMQGVFV